jgi:hypothetical protein
MIIYTSYIHFVRHGVRRRPASLRSTATMRWCGTEEGEGEEIREKGGGADRDQIVARRCGVEEGEGEETREKGGGAHRAKSSFHGVFNGSRMSYKESKLNSVLNRE